MKLDGPGCSIGMMDIGTFATSRMLEIAISCSFVTLSYFLSPSSDLFNNRFWHSFSKHLNCSICSKAMIGALVRSPASFAISIIILLRVFLPTGTLENHGLHGSYGTFGSGCR